MGITQTRLGHALGMTGTFIGLMERGIRPIEPRTRLATLYLRDNPQELD